MSIYDKTRTEIEGTLERLRARLAGDEVGAPERYDLAVCIRALEVHLYALDEATRELCALEAFNKAKPTERFEAYARARGFNPHPEALRAKWPNSLVLETYLTAFKLGSVTESMLSAAVLQGDRQPRVWRQGEDENPRAFALRATAECWGFTKRGSTAISLEACRVHLWRLREDVRSNPTGWRAGIDPDFPVPVGAEWDHLSKP